MVLATATGSVLDMTPRRETPEIPPSKRAVWEELLRVTEEREKASEDLARASARARELVIDLLRAGVRRQDLVDRPFSSAGLTKIQQEEGLITRQTKG